MSIKTDGSSKIIVLSDKTIADEENVSLRLRTSNNRSKRLSSDVTKSVEEVRITQTVKITVSEILLSLVTKITEREDNNVMKSVRREIAVITI